jgi:hypothetical protein
MVHDTRRVQSYFPQFGLFPWQGKSDVRTHHWNVACQCPEISLFFRIYRKSTRTVYAYTQSSKPFPSHSYRIITSFSMKCSFSIETPRYVTCYSRTRYRIFHGPWRVTRNPGTGYSTVCLVSKNFSSRKFHDTCTPFTPCFILKSYSKVREVLLAM